MTDEWVETTLGDVGEFINGYPFKPAELSGSKLPVIRIKQLLDPSAETDFTDVRVPDKVRLSDGDLVFSWSGSLASRIWDRGPAALNQHLFRVIERPGVDRGWLHLALDHAVDDLMEKTHGTTMKHVTKGVLQSHSVLLPPLPVQRRIVDLLAHLNTHLTNVRREKECLANARNAFIQRSLHVISQQRLGGEHWPRLTLGELTATTRPICYGVLKPGPYTPNGIPLIRIQDMEHDVLAPDGHHLIAPSLDAEFRRSRLAGGELLLSIQGTVGRVAICPEEMAGANISRTVALIQPDSRLMPEFLRVQLQQVARSSGFDDSGSTRASLNISTIREMKVVVPSRDIQEKLVAEVSAIDELVASLVSESSLLSKLHSALLAELLSGSVHIDESYDSLLPEVA